MNYIIEILAFYNWLEWNPLPSSAICLWHSLMHMANKTGWQKEFTVPMGVLESKTGLKRTTVCEARNLLKQLGRIDWRSRNGNQCAVYALCSFGEHNTEHNADAMANTTLTQPRTQSRLLNKQKETKLNETRDIKKEDKEKKDDYGVVGGFDEFWQAYPRKESKQSAVKAFNKIKPNTDLVAVMINALEIQKKSEQWQKDKGQFIPHPSTWLNQRRWEDELEQKTQEEIYAEFDIKPFVLGVDDQ